MEKENLERRIKEHEKFAAFVHGGAFAYHALGVFYNLKKKNYIDMSIHGLVAVYDLFATFKHYKGGETNEKINSNSRIDWSIYD